MKWLWLAVISQYIFVIWNVKEFNVELDGYRKNNTQSFHDSTGNFADVFDRKSVKENGLKTYFSMLLHKMYSIHPTRFCFS